MAECNRLIKSNEKLESAKRKLQSEKEKLTKENKQLQSQLSTAETKTENKENVNSIQPQAQIRILIVLQELKECKRSCWNYQKTIAKLEENMEEATYFNCSC